MSMKQNITVLYAMFMIFSGVVWGAEKRNWLPKELTVFTQTGSLLIKMPDKQNIGFLFSYISPQLTIFATRATLESALGFPQFTPSGYAYKGSFDVKSIQLEYEQNITPLKDHSIECSWKTNGYKETKDTAAVMVRLPEVLFKDSEITIDGSPLRLPNLNNNSHIGYQVVKKTFHARKINVPLPHSVMSISGELQAIVCASRNAKDSYYGIRIFALRSIEKPNSRDVTFNITFTPYPSFPISLKNGGNSYFRDEVANDRKGGWTDQGAGKDLRNMKPGNFSVYNINYNIVNDAEGPSCIVLGGKQATYLPKSAEINMDNLKMSRLYLLHGAAWAVNRKGEVLGQITVTYSQGVTEVFDMIIGRDVYDWSHKVQVPNARIVWTSPSESFDNVFLYQSSIALQNKPVRKIAFSTSGKGALWMIAALSGLKSGPLPLLPPLSVTSFEANEKWRPVKWSPAGTIKKGTALDFSQMLEAPAGRDGDVICMGDNFEFKNNPGSIVRFWGDNITHEMTAIKKEEAEAVADELATMGCNAVRFHTYLKWLSKNDGSPELSQKGMDKFDYLISCLRKRGIYYTFPLYGDTRTALVYLDDPEFPELKGKNMAWNFIPMVPISSVAMEWLKTFSKNFLSHVNPYTGLAIKDDPALIGIELLNESELSWMISRDTSEINLKGLYKRKCKQYLKGKRGKTPSDAEIEFFLPQFIAMLQGKNAKTMIPFLRKLGVNKPITDISATNTFPVLLVRNDDLDYVERHNYWDLQEQIPANYKLRNPNQYNWLDWTNTFSARIFGKPHSCGEYNGVYPSPYWSFFPPFQAAIANLQNLSGSYRFATFSPYPSFVFNPHPALSTKSYNPLCLFSMRIGAFFTHKKEILPSNIKIPIGVTREYNKNLSNTTISFYASLALHCQIGAVVLDQGTDLSTFDCIVVPPEMELPSWIDKDLCFPADKNLYHKVSAFLNRKGISLETRKNPIEVNSKNGTCRISTPSGECFLLPEHITGFNGKNFSVSKSENVGAFFVGSLDNKRVTDSQRLIVFYLTDIKNTDCTINYGNENGSLLKPGKPPFLLQQGDATFSIKSNNKILPKVWALKYDGSHGVKVPCRKTDDGFSFTVSAVTSPDIFFAFEVIWK